MLKISHLQKNYRGFSLDCSMEVQPGMITGLIGRNGSGFRLLTYLCNDILQSRFFSVYSGRNRSGISPDSLSHYHTQNLHMIMFT